MNLRLQSLGPYQLVRLIAEGGMAEIYLARTQANDGADRFLAIKVIRDRFSRDEDLIETLTNEAQLTVQLRHPNILQVFDLAQYNDRYFMTMEFIDGRDLSVVMGKLQARRLQMPFAAAAFIVSEAAKGLHYAHICRDQRGLPLNIVHRDVSPQNILISFRGVVKVADFGIAKANVKRSDTQLGIIKGKFAYMSPEQAWGDTLDKRSDVYSLGVVLYELLTGQAMYGSQDQFTVIKAVRSGAITPPRALRPDIPADLEAIVLHALERDRTERFQSASEMAKELRRYLDQIAPGYDAPILAGLMQQTFGDEVKEIARVLHSLDDNASTRAIPVPVAPKSRPADAQPLMDRTEYVPKESSLLFDLKSMQAASASPIPSNPKHRLQPQQNQNTPTTIARPSSGPLGRVLNAKLMDQIMSEIDEEAPQLFVPQDEDDPPTLSYSVEELRQASGDFAALTAASQPQPFDDDEDDIPTRAIKRPKLPQSLLQPPPAPPSLGDDFTDLDFKAPIALPDLNLPPTFPPTPVLPELAHKRVTPAAFAPTASMPSSPAAPSPASLATERLSPVPPPTTPAPWTNTHRLLWAAVSIAALAVVIMVALLLR